VPLRYLVGALVFSALAAHQLQGAPVSGSKQGNAGQQSEGSATQQTDGSGNQKGTGDKSSNSGGSQSNDITLGDKTGKIESYLLATATVHKAAQAIAKAIAVAVPDQNVPAAVASSPVTTAEGTNVGAGPAKRNPEASGKWVVIYDQVEQDRLNALSQFRVQYFVLSTIYSGALAQSVPELPEQAQQYTSESFGAAVQAASSLLEAAAQLVSLLKTSITVNGVDVTLDQEILVDEVASALRSGTPKVIALRPSLYFPSIFDQQVIANSRTLTNLTELFQYKQRTLSEIKKLQSEIAALNQVIGQTTNIQLKKLLTAGIQPRLDKVAQLQAANVAFDSMLGGLLGGESQAQSGSEKGSVTSGSSPGGPAAQTQGPCPQGNTGNPKDNKAQEPKLENLAPPAPCAGQRSSSMENSKSQVVSPQGAKNATLEPAKSANLADIIFADLLQSLLESQNVPILTLQIQQSGGGYMTKSGILTWFSGPSLYHTGGTVTSFTLLSTATAEVLAAGAVPIYGGYVKSNGVEQKIKSFGSPNPWTDNIGMKAPKGSAVS
jgi:hypothetical protein